MQAGAAVGLTFGDLLVVEALQGQQVVVKCKCGNYMVALFYSLERGSTRSCGRCLSEEVIAKFWSLVDKSAGPDACWPWMGDRKKEGYGDFRLGPRSEIASRISWQIHNKQSLAQLDDYYEVCHSCDNPPCVNPAHLSLGTHEENIAQRERGGKTPKGETHGRVIHPEAYGHLKGGGHWRHQEGYEGRAATGESHGMAKLTREQALEVRRLYAETNLTQMDIGRQMGLCQAHVSDVVSGKIWAELQDSDALTPRQIRLEKRKKRDLQILVDIRAAGITPRAYKDVAAKYGVSMAVVYRVMGKTYKKTWKEKKEREALVGAVVDPSIPPVPVPEPAPVVAIPPIIRKPSDSGS